MWRIPSDKMKVRGNGAHIVPLSKQAREILNRLCALGIDVKPEDVAGVVAFLASEEANYVTGAIYTVDGGQGI